jgi:sugar transferase EpsL
MYENIKSAAERIISLLLVVTFSPFFLLLKSLYWLLLNQPLVSREQCVGWRGKEFTRLRFNTLKEFYPKSGAFKFIRNIGLDELPQLWNVVKGEMSWIGSRPESVENYMRHPHNSYKRLRSRPGLVGLWQVSSYRGGNLHRAWRLDLFFEAKRGFRIDLCILVRLVRKSISRFKSRALLPRDTRSRIYAHHTEATDGGALKYLEYLSLPELESVLFLLFQRGSKPVPSHWAAKKNVLVVPCHGFVPLRFLQCFFHSLLFFSSERPSHVHAHSTVSGTVCRLLGMVFGYRVSYTPHCYAFTYPHRIPIVKWALGFLERMLCCTAFTAIHVSAEEAEIHRTMNPSASIRVIPSPSNWEFHPIPCPSSWESRLIIVVGTDRRQKGYEILEAIQRLLDEQGDGFQIVVLGGEKDKGRVKYLGWQENLYAFYKRAFCILNVSFSEGCSLALLDAMQCGLPVIGVDIPANRELLSGRGILVSGRNPKSYFTAIQNLAGNYPLFECIHLESRRFAESRHSLGVFLDRFSDHYLEAGISLELGSTESGPGHSAMKNGMSADAICAPIHGQVLKHESPSFQSRPGPNLPLRRMQALDSVSSSQCRQRFFRSPPFGFQK